MESHPTALASHSDLTPADLFEMLFRRWRCILAGLLVGIALGLSYLLLKTPVYEASIQLRIGQVAGTGAFEAPELLASRLLAEFGEDIADGIRRERPFLKRAGSSQGLPNAVSLVAVGDTPEDATAFLQKVLDFVRSAHSQPYDENVKALNSRIEAISSQRLGLQRQYEQSADLIDALKKDSPVQASILALERGRVLAAMAMFDAELPGLQQKKSPPQTVSTGPLGPLSAPSKPAAPQAWIVLTISALLGLALGVILTFTANFFRPTR